VAVAQTYAETVLPMADLVIPSISALDLAALRTLVSG
jgi:hypothetical protein